MNSPRINLLPHREERRKRARQHFAIMGGVTAVIGLAIVGAGHVFYAQKIEGQNGRNNLLKREIAALDKQIVEIKDLQGKIEAQIRRKDAIEQLQLDRAQAVRLLDGLVRQMPEGVYLKTVKQKGLSVQLSGYAQSNARVSTLMRNIEASPWLESPSLVQIQASSVDNKRVSAFDLVIRVKKTQSEQKDGGKAPAKGAKGAKKR